MKQSKIKIGKLYFFDTSFSSYGELVKINHNGHSFFRPVHNENKNYHEENGLIEFATIHGFYQYNPTQKLT